MIKLKRSDYEKMLAHAEKELPNEACGLLGGTLDENGKTVSEVYLLTNIDASNEHFSMDPKEQLAAVKDMRSKVSHCWATGILTPNLPRVPPMRTRDLLMTARQAI